MEYASLDSNGVKAITLYLSSLSEYKELHNISEDRVRRIINEYEILSEDIRNKAHQLIQDVVGKYTACPKLKANANKLQRRYDFFTKPGICWCIDITEIKTKESKLYLCAIIDLCGRYLIGYSTGIKINKRLVKDSINDAITNASKFIELKENPLFIHSDRGIQFRSKEIQEFLKENMIISSMSKPHSPNDNACIESFFANLKCEYLERFELKNIAFAKELIKRYIYYYNYVRIHETCLDTPFNYWYKQYENSQ